MSESTNIADHAAPKDGASEASRGPLDLDRIQIDPACALRVPAALSTRRQVLAFVSIEGTMHVACRDPADAAAIQAVQRAVGQPIIAHSAEPNSLRRALQRIFGDGAGGTGDGKPGQLRGKEGARPADGDPDSAVHTGNDIMHAAMVRRASDIHIDPQRDGLRVRFRVDGKLEDHLRLPATATSAVISRFKVLAGMDIAEKRAPQDGRFTQEFATSQQRVDVRVATLPTKHGERMTLRLLAMQTESLTLENLGFNESDLGLFSDAIQKPHGLILLTGPTGSGKTTTLYAAIRRLIAAHDLNIVTIEDPVEYEIDGVAQVEVDSADKVNFAKALRSVLRHDPDVVMIGEIRDAETADIAIKSSLTGHLVFSTLHTNSAPSAVTRLIDMGVARYLVAATMRLVIAQRLVRRLCPQCRSPYELSDREALMLGREELAGRTVYRPQGCIYCANRGFVGRVGLFECLPFDEEFARQIAHGGDEPDLVAAMRTAELRRLVDDGIDKLLNGDCTVEAVLRAVAI